MFHRFVAIFATLLGTIIYPTRKRHFWVDDFPFPVWWDMWSFPGGHFWRQSYFQMICNDWVLLYKSPPKRIITLGSIQQDPQDWFIYLMMYHKNQPNVGKYVSPMDLWACFTLLSFGEPGFLQKWRDFRSHSPSKLAKIHEERMVFQPVFFP